MKLVGVLMTAPVFLAGVRAFKFGSDERTRITDFCAEGSEITDPKNCQTKLNKQQNEEEVLICFDKTGDVTRFNDEFYECVRHLLTTPAEEDANEFAMAEFLGGIGQDKMVAVIVGEINTLDRQIDNSDNSTMLKSLPGGADGTLGANTTMEAAQETLGMLKRFIELKQLVSWMQPKDKRISRYCFYGCWCLPDGAHSFVAGEGHPVDLVDRACQLFWFCYVCAKQEMTAIIGGKKRTCEPEKTKYSFRFKYDKKHPAHYDKRDIICKDNWYMPMNSRDKWRSNCAKAFCECDRGIAMRLYQSWKHWDKSRHRIWSQRVTDCPHKTACEQMPINTAKQRHEREVCLRKGCLFIVQDRCTYGAGGRNELDQTPICCGDYENDGSRWEMRDHGGRYACCNHNKGTGFGDMLPWNGAWYNKVTHCCANGKVESAGHPSC